MIRPVEARVSEREELFEQVECFGRARLHQAVPGEVSGRKVSGVELGELAHVDGDALPRLRPTDDSAVSDGVLAGVLRYDVITYVEYQGRICLALEIPQGAFDVDEAQHLVGFDLRFDVRASQIWVKRLSARCNALSRRPGDPGPP